jgi:hypothetical protein
MKGEKLYVPTIREGINRAKSGLFNKEKLFFFSGRITKKLYHRGQWNFKAN